MINNPDLVDGYKYLYASDYTEIEALSESVYNKYIKPNLPKNLPKKNQNDTYQSILSNIFSKQNKRDQRIDIILGDENNPIPKTSEESTQEVKPKSIINRLFGN